MHPEMIREYIKKVGTGPLGARDLTRSEAGDAARLILSGAATSAQIGALLLGLRLKGETAEEMGGFLDALGDALTLRPATRFDLDVGDPYDGKKRSASLVVPAAIAASGTGLRIVLHGLPKVPVKQGPGVLDDWKALGRSPSRLPVPKIPDAEGAALCLSQESFLPELARLLPLRQELGLRTLWNTVEKCVNPLGAAAQIIGIFHEPIIDKLRHALDRNGAAPSRRILFVCGAEGGVDLHPHRATFCHLLDPALGPEIHPVTIPPPAGSAGPLPPPGDPLFLRDIANDPSHPLALHLKRQAALFLFASGKSTSFSEAEERLAEAPSDGSAPSPPPFRSLP